MLSGPSIIAIAIIVGGLVFIAIGILLFSVTFGSSNSDIDTTDTSSDTTSDTENQSQVNASSELKSMVKSKAAGVKSMVKGKATDFLSRAAEAVSDFLTQTLKSFAPDFLTQAINTLIQVTKGVIASISSILILIGVGLCMLGVGLFKRKYLACVLTVILMFVAIVIDIGALGFVSGGFLGASDNGGIVHANLVYILIGILIGHLVANAIIIYYLTKKSTISMFQTKS